MGQEILKKFDRYFLLDCLAQGGMAEIFRARPASVDAGARLIVIKRILTHHAKSREFIEMFKSETKVMMGFSHSNVIQLYDFGDAKGQLYIAMEYVDGKNLRQFLSKIRDSGKKIPLDVALYITEQAAMGLHYAHSYKDKMTGEHLGIVHRDVSPQNILIAYEGNIKLIDFGIAKASTNTEATRVGVIKGKPSYLSPEQVTGEELDGRSDIFSLGAVLWEVLTGKKLFAPPAGDNEFAVLKLIESSETHVQPPSKFNSEIPEEVDQVVMKLLAKEREKRFQSVEEVQIVLRKFLNRNYPDFTPSDLSKFVKTLFKDAIVEDRRRLRLLNARAEQLLKDDLGQVVEGTDPFKKVQHRLEGAPPADPKGKESLPVTTNATHNSLRELEIKEEGDQKRVQISQPVITHHHVMSGNSPRWADGNSISKSINRTPRKSTDWNSFLKWISVAAAGILFLVFAHKMFFSQSSVEDYSSTTQPNVSRDISSAEPVKPEVPKGYNAPKVMLHLKLPPGFKTARIELDGKILSEADPTREVTLDTSHVLRVNREGYVPFERQFSLISNEVGNAKEWLMEVPLVPLKYGELMINSTPSAEVTISEIGVETGKDRTIKVRTPASLSKFPTGQYRIEMKNSVLGMEKTVVRPVEEGKTTRIEEALTITP